MSASTPTSGLTECTWGWEKTALLCVVGAREDGAKELLGMELGYRESTEIWSGVLRSLRDRGMEAPLLAVGDGALGLWSALDEVFSTTVRLTSAAGTTGR